MNICKFPSINFKKTDSLSFFNITGIELLLIFFSVFLSFMMYLFTLIGLTIGFSSFSLLISVFSCFLLSFFLFRGEKFSIRFDYRVNIIFVIAVFILIIPLILISFTPPSGWDEIAYSISLPRDYSRENGFFYNLDYGPYSAFPGNYEALTTVSLLLTADIWPIKLLNVFLFFGCMTAAYSISLRLNSGKFIASIVALLILTAPVAITSVANVKNDISVTFFETIAILIFVLYQKNPSRKLALCLGVTVGIALGVKYSALHFALCFIVCIAVYFAIKVKKVAYPHAPDIVVFLVTASIFAFPWYIRNIAIFGNPFFPFYHDFFQGFFGADYPYTNLQVSIANEIWSGLDNWSFKSGSIIDFHNVFSSNYGLIWSLGLIASIYFITTANRLDSIAYFIVIFFICFTSFTFRFGFWEPRYLILLLIICCVLSGVIFRKFMVVSQNNQFFCILSFRNKRISKHIPTLLILLIMCNGIFNQYKIIYPRIYDGFTLERSEFYKKRARFYSVAVWANTHLDLNDRIALMGPQPFYFLDRSYFHMHPLSEKGDFQSVSNAVDLCHRFREIGITYIGFTRDHEPTKYMPLVNRYHDNLIAILDNMEKNNLIVKKASFENANIFKVNCSDRASLRN